MSNIELCLGSSLKNPKAIINIIFGSNVDTDKVRKCINNNSTYMKQVGLISELEQLEIIKELELKLKGKFENETCENNKGK